MLDDLHVGDLAALDVDLNLNHGFAALAFARVRTVLVGGLSGTGGHHGGSGDNDELLHSDVFH